LLKAGVILFVVVYAALFLILTARDFNHIVSGERRIFIVVLAALPLLGARILFGVLSIFLTDQTFAILGEILPPGC
jgi:hypothetical protein